MDLEPQLLSISLAGWPGLEGNAHIDLAWSRTVLVGKNGAGKSVLMEAMIEAARTATARRARIPGNPVSFRCAIGTPALTQFSYEYRIDPVGEIEATSPGAETETAPSLSWFERCWRPDGTHLWSVSDGILSTPESARPIPEGVGLLAMGRSIEHSPREAQQLRSLLSQMHLIRAGVPRSSPGTKRPFVFVTGKRDESILPGRIIWHSQASGRVERLAQHIAQLREYAPAEFKELNELVVRLGLAQQLAFFVVFDKESEQLGVVQLDDVNLGLLSDGTLRVLEILSRLIAGHRSVLCIEEPETGVHPGLLERLLAVIKSYSAARPVMLSTHSPYVVNWCDPSDLRLVERTAESTTARSLSNEEVERLEAYLLDEGTLDSYLFEESGDSFDEEDE